MFSLMTSLINKIKFTKESPKESGSYKWSSLILFVTIIIKASGPITIKIIPKVLLIVLARHCAYLTITDFILGGDDE